MESLLTIEQQFTLRKYQEQVKQVTKEDLEDLFLDLVRQKMAQENLFRDIMKRDFKTLQADPPQQSR